MRILNKALVVVSKAQFRNQSSYAIASCPLLILSLVLSIPSAAAASIQAPGKNGGAAEGLVRDALGRPISGAKLILKHARKPVADVHTDARGTFRFGPVLPERYGLEIFKAGFKRAEPGLTVSSGAGRPVLVSLDAKPLELPSDLRAARSRAQ